MYTSDSPCFVQQKLTQHYKVIILQLKKKREHPTFSLVPKDIHFFSSIRFLPQVCVIQMLGTISSLFLWEMSFSLCSEPCL